MADAPNRIRELRMAHKPRLSQQALGERIGTSKMTVSDLERGNMELTVSYMRKIAKALGVIPADLLSVEDNPGALNPDERRWVERYQSASPETQEQLERVSEAILPFRHRDAA